MKLEYKDKKNIKRILTLFKPHIKRVVVILSCMLVSAGVSMALPRISQQLMDRGLLAQNFRLLVIYTLAGLALLLFDQGLGFIEARNRIYLNSVIPFSLSKEAFKHTLRMKMDYFGNTNASEIMSAIGTDVGNIARICDNSTFYIITSAFRIIGGFIGLLLLDWRLTVMVALVVPFRYILVKYIARKRKRLFDEYLKISREQAAFYGDTVAGVKEVKLWGLDRIKTREYIKTQRKLMRLQIRMGLTDKLNEFSETVLFQLIIDSIYIVGAHLVFQNSLTVGELFAFITYSTYVTAPISAILNIGYNFVNILPSAKRYFEYMDMEGEPYRNRKGVSKLPVKTGGVAVRYEDVSFSYTGEKQILNGVSFEIREGEKVAIVGSNGSGKSTVINLLLRLYQPSSGRILLYGTDINAFSLREYRKMISVVSQDMYLFNASIRENITLYHRGGEEGFIKAVKECGIGEFIERLPEKYDTRIGRNGAKLSGGERQK